jgi:cytochrome oxidase Cu insertion factor (SCO1/SenC/PrrC family)
VSSRRGIQRAARPLALLAALACAPISGAQQGAPLAEPDFIPPAPGTYTLHHIMAAPEGQVLGIDGRPQPLSHYTRGQITLLGFIYTQCTDPEGCPLAYRVFDALKAAITATPSLHGKLRFVTLSFDPARDSPDVMRQYAGSRVAEKDGGLPWYFLTTRSARELMPLVEGFGQDINITFDRSVGRPQRELSHVLKVFLIDRAGDVREIYTSTFLYPRLVLNDIETLLIEEDPRRSRAPVKVTSNRRPGLTTLGASSQPWRLANLRVEL